MANISGTFRRIGSLFRRPAGVLLVLLAVVLSAVFLAGYFLPAWLPAVAARFLPADTRLVVAGRPHWRNSGVMLPELAVQRGACRWLEGRNITLVRKDGAFHLAADRLRLDTACAAADNPAEPGQPLDWQTALDRLPPLTVSVGTLEIAPWGEYAGQVTVTHQSGQTRLHYDSGPLAADLLLQGRQLEVKQVVLRAPGSGQALRLQGSLRLSPAMSALPEQGQLSAAMALPDGAPLTVGLDWQRRQGVLSVTDKTTQILLARLPWQVEGDEIIVRDGQWRWPYAGQPFAGNVAMTLKNWQSGLTALEITARLNVLTQGLRGKANAVLNLGPGRLGLTDNALDVRLDGQANQGDLALYASIPGQLRGSLLDPVLVMQPGSLLRVTGPVINGLNITSARLPLAGVQLSSRGLTGRLQAILLATAGNLGRFTLHLDGRATDFLPDQGQWRWRYWGGGDIRIFKANWDISGRGSWLADVIELSELTSGFNQLEYGLITASAPRLNLVSPVRWRRDVSQPSLSGALRLAARRVDIRRGGFMPSPQLTLQLTGRGPQDFLWRGQLLSGPIGPVRLNGRWDGQRLRGQAWWPRQPLRVFQTLLAPALKLTLHDGDFHAQSAFSAAPGQGFLAGGHAVVSQGDVWYGETHLQGIALGLSYHLQDQRWQLGVREPITLTIDAVSTPVSFNRLAVGLQGYYPYDNRHPLTLTQLSVETLGGALQLSPLELPQREAAVLKVQSVEMSELITALKLRQFAISGRVSGEMPLNFADPQGYIRNGWLANDNAMTLRLDKQFADQLAGRNLVNGVAVNWLRYLEITRTRASVALDRMGNLLLQAQISGTNPQLSAHREVRLNYRHQENLFQLWRSLRFGSLVEQTLEKQAATPAGTARGTQ